MKQLHRKFLRILFAWGVGLAIGMAQSAHTTGVDANRSFTVAIDPNYAPYTLRDSEGKAAGILVDIWKLWARKTHSTVRFRFYPWNESIEATRRGEVDFHSGTTPDQNWMIASKPFWTIETSFFTLRDNPYRDARSLRRATIGTIDPYYGMLARKRLGPLVKIRKYSDYGPLLHALERGEIDAFIEDTEAVWYYLIKIGKVPEIRIIHDPKLIVHNPVQAVTNPEHAALIPLINRGLSLISPAEKESIRNRWFSTHRPEVHFRESAAHHEPNKITLVAFLTALLGLLAFLLIRDQRERRMIERLAKTDDLTGLKNKREFTRVFYKTKIESPYIGLLIVDVDYFKAYNDTYGHLMGDEVLRNIGAILQSVETEHLQAFRVGGEEFALLLQSQIHDQNRLCRIAETIRKKVAALRITHEPSPYGIVTVSIGGALSEVRRMRRELFVQADNALYTAKEKGRNRIVCVDPSQDADTPDPEEKSGSGYSDKDARHFHPAISHS